MMEAIKKGAINCILIRDLSRLGRDYIEMGRLIDKVFPFLGVRFISINDQLDTLHGLEEKKSFEVEIKNLVNDLYSKDISKKITAHNIHQASQGYYIGTSAPYGYCREKQEKGTRLVIDKAVQPILETIFQQALDGKSMFQITQFLNEGNIAVPRSYRQTRQIYRSENDTKRWKAGNLLRLIKMPVYRGELVQRTRNKLLSEADYISTENAHEAYITKEEYNKIVSLSSSRRSLKKTTRQRTPNRYKGLLYARGSSTQMYRYCKHFKNSDYYYFTDYINGSKNLERQTVYISEKSLDRIILKLVQSEMKRLGTVEELVARLGSKKEECITSYQKQIRNYQKVQQWLQAELSELYEAYSLNRQEREIYLSQKSELTSKMGTISQEIAHFELAIRQVEEEYQRQVTWVKALSGCQNQSIITEEFLNVLIERIEVDVDKTVTLTFTCQIGGVEHD